ncbi:hypothetical protein C2E19_17615 [Pseudomonas sp. DTU12.3]|uniref:Ig-like domain-containing protein n=1 Tax=Pseudomonas sp. DTU12.3 TaxID=2073078 RepID=UPI00101337A4|nr:Ig-like domain-containing protein [Pseudomonas sp. DTU12.3]QAX85554.1 hypothetical protein C2E19_17615 [Pseudomonas sp. DTU12.3]
MNTRERPENTVLALSPPRVPEATTPVIGAHYGVPKHVYDLKPMGLKVDIDPPLAGTLQPGDVITLVLNGLSGNSKSINAGEENFVTTLYINKGLLLPDRINELVYTITRGSSNIGTSTPVLTVLYNAIRPGMEDRTPGDGAHSELGLILPADVLEDGIDAERAKQGVLCCFSYPYCRAHDVIWLNCNGQDVYRTVSVSEAPATPSSEPTTLCVMVEEEVFIRAGDHPNFVFSFTVTDQLGNGPDTDSPWSGIVPVDVNLTQQRLVAPDVTEDPDDPNDDPATIDLDKLGSKDLTVLVHAFAPLWQLNDVIRMLYSATPPSGPVVQHTVETSVGRIPFTYKLLVPNAKVIADSVVRAKYELVRTGAVIATSKTTTAQVTGGDTIDLLPPSLVSPALSPIDIPAYPDGVTVRIEYLGAQADDRARLVEVNPPAGSPQFPLVGFNANKRVNTLLTPAFLTARQGKDIELRWNLNRDGGQAGKSPPLNLSILPITEAPTIASVKGSPSGVEIPDGGTTIDTTVILTGTATANLEVEIFDGTTSKGRSPVNASGTWTHRLENLIDGLHSLTAKALYGLEPVSTPHTITVAKAPELIIDPTPMVLDGIKLIQDYGWPTKEVVGNVKTRVPSGGVGPYTYSSSNPSIASVDSGGKVSGLKQGSATITVRGAGGSTGSYSVIVTNVYRMRRNWTLMEANACRAWISSSGGEPAMQDKGARAILANFLNLDQAGPFIPNLSLAFPDPYQSYVALGPTPQDPNRHLWVMLYVIDGQPPMIHMDSGTIQNSLLPAFVFTPE